MACPTLTEIAQACERNSGGLYNAWFGDMDDILTITENSATFNVDALTAANAPISVNIKRKTSNYTDEEAQDVGAAGSSVATLTVNLVLHRRQKEKSYALNVLGAGQRYLYGILEDANGKFWYGKYLQLTSNGGGSGTNRADGSNYNVVLTADNEHTMYEISSAVVASLLATS